MWIPWFSHDFQLNKAEIVRVAHTETALFIPHGVLRHFLMQQI